jgi:hypothetical protein
MHSFCIRFRAIGLALIAAFAVGCANQSGIATLDQAPLTQSSHDEQTLPFDQTSTTTGSSLVPASEELLAGTPLTIRLRTVLSSESSRPGDSFDALVDEPVVVEGRTLLPRGTIVSGTVLSSKASSELHGSGYLRLTLSSMVVNGVSIPLSTNSIFAKASSHQSGPTARSALAATNLDNPAGNGHEVLLGAGTPGRPITDYRHGTNDVHFTMERRLTFRLKHTLSLKG